MCKGQVRISQNETTNQNVSRENEKNSLINVGSQNIYSNLFSNISKKIGTHHFLVHQQFSSYISFCFCKCLLGNCNFILFSYTLPFTILVSIWTAQTSKRGNVSAARNTLLAHKVKSVHTTSPTEVHREDADEGRGFPSISE